MILLQNTREHIREHPVRMMISALFILVIMQVVMDESAYHRFSIAAIAFVFAFKSWVNLVFSITTHKQKGETALSMAIERYFWSLLGQSVAFTILFFSATVAGSSPQQVNPNDLFGIDWVVIRNGIRTIAIISVMSVIIYGDQTLEALKDYIQREKERTEGVSA